MKLANISSKDLSTFETERRKGGRRVSVVTVKRDLACLSSIFSSAEEWEWVTRNPVLPYIRARAKKGVMVENDSRERYLDHDEGSACSICRIRYGRPTSSPSTPG